MDIPVAGKSLSLELENGPLSHESDNASQSTSCDLRVPGCQGK